MVPDRLKLTLGAKVEHNEFTGFEFQPSARLLWTINKKQVAWGAISRAANSAVTMVITNTPGLALTVEASTNFTSWTVLGAPTYFVSPATFTDNTANGIPYRFYRASHPR